MAISENNNRQNVSGVISKGITVGLMLKIDAARETGQRTCNSRRTD
jgi:hypothetical protein